MILFCIVCCILILEKATRTQISQTDTLLFGVCYLILVSAILNPEAQLLMIGITEAPKQLFSLLSPMDGGSGSDTSGGESGVTEVSPSPPNSPEPTVEEFRAWADTRASEEDILRRIEALERLELWDIPGQSRPGEYAENVRANFEAVNGIPHDLESYRYFLDSERNQCTMMEEAAQLQIDLLQKLHSETYFREMQEVSYYKQPQEAAAEFIKHEFLDINLNPDLNADERFLAHLNRFETFQTQLEQGKQAEIYQRFRAEFTNEAERIGAGLPVPPADPQ